MFLFRSSLPVVFIDCYRLSSYSPQEQWSIIKHSTSPHIRTHSSASSQQGNTWTVKKDTLVVWFTYGVLYSLFLWASTAPEELTCPADISHLPTSNPSFLQGRTESCGCFPGSVYIGIMALIWFNQLSQILMNCHIHVIIATENITLPETNGLHLNMDGWNTIFLLGWPIFRGYVSFRECITVC